MHRRKVEASSEHFHQFFAVVSDAAASAASVMTDE